MTCGTGNYIPSPGDLVGSGDATVMVEWVNLDDNTYGTVPFGDQVFDQTRDGGFAGRYRGRVPPEGWTASHRETNYYKAEP